MPPSTPNGNPNPACVDSSPAQMGRAKQVWSQTSAFKLLGSFINEATKKDISDEGMGCQGNLIFQELVGSHHFMAARHHGLLLVHPKLCPRHRAKGQGRECPAPPKEDLNAGRMLKKRKGVVAANPWANILQLDSMAACWGMGWGQVCFLDELKALLLP